MTVSHLLALALQAELLEQYGIALEIDQCEALVEAVLKRMAKAVAAKPQKAGEVIAWPWQVRQEPTRTEGGTG